MATTLLTGSGSAQLGRRPIEITVEAEGGRTPVDVGVNPDTRTIRPQPGMVVLPGLDHPVVVWAAPRAGGTFPPASILYIVAAVTDPATGEKDQVVLPGLDVSGLTVKDLLEIVPERSEYAVSVAGGRSDAVLAPLGNAALAAARSSGPASGVPYPSDGITVVVDTSASVRPHLDSGAVATIVDLLTAVASAQTDGGQVTVLLGTDVIDAPPATLAEAVTAAAARCPITCGFRVDPTPSRPGVTYVITDAPPADLHGRAGALWHVVVLGSASLEMFFAPRTRVPVTVIDPLQPDGLRMTLLRDERQLRTVVDRLVRTEPAA